jgi:hypothetical protein
MPDGTRRVIHIPFQSSEEKAVDSSLCKHCFYFRTIDAGRRMIIEPCGGPNCVSIVNSTYLKEIEPAIKYNFSQCGTVNKNGYSISNKALQLKVSTGVKNTLRPAEYPWLVSFFVFKLIKFLKIKKIFFIGSN